jgi:hypothetical protein
MYIQASMHGCVQQRITCHNTSTTYSYEENSEDMLISSCRNIPSQKPQAGISSATIQRPSSVEGLIMACEIPTTNALFGLK